MSNIHIRLKKRVFNPHFYKYIDNTSRYLIFYGGAGSGKSYFIAQRYILKMLQDKCNLLVVRKTGKSNRDSTFALFKQIISKWNISQYFKINESDLRIKNIINNNEIVFAGLDDVEKLKSITFSNGELTNIWIEEASEILESDFNQLDIRLRGKGTKKQIVISFNPIDINHWIKKKFFDTPSKDITISHSTYKDNNFLDSEYKKVLESYKESDEYYYNVYCLGEWGVLGKTVFNAKILNDRLRVLKEPLKVGYFTYKYENDNITNIKWIEDRENGYINIYQVPNSPRITKYCIGGDTSGEGSDYFTAHVLDAKTGVQVAVMKRQFDPDEYTKQMYCLGMYYKEALIGIEANFDSYPIRKLQEMGYSNQYVRTRIDTFTNKPEKHFGFKTTSITRPTIISRLIEIVRDEVDTINDKDTIEELLTIIRNEKGRIEAPEGGHDDQMMGLAIAHEIRNQVSFVEEPITPYPDFKEFTMDIETGSDYGEEIVII